MSRATVLIVVTLLAAMFVGSDSAFAASAPIVTPDTAHPGDTISVMPTFPAETKCELELDSTVFPDSSFACGSASGTYPAEDVVVPDLPGPHVITVCSPNCAAPAQSQSAPFTVLAPSTVSSPVTRSSPQSLSATRAHTAVPSNPGKPVRPAHGPTGRGSGVPTSLIVGLPIALVVLLAIGTTIFVRRGPGAKARYVQPAGPDVRVTTSVRVRTVRVTRSPQRRGPGLGFATCRTRATCVRHEEVYR